MANAVGQKAKQAGALSGEMPIFFGRKTLEFVKQRVVRPVSDKNTRGA